MADGPVARHLDFDHTEAVAAQLFGGADFEHLVESLGSLEQAAFEDPS